MTGQSDHDLLIEINTKLESITECLVGFSTWQTTVNERLRAIELAQRTYEANITALQKDVDAFKSKSNVLDIITGTIAVLGSILAGFFGGKN